MELEGRIQNGVVVFVGGNPLPEGALVNVVYPISKKKPPAKNGRIQLPLVHCDKPGSIDLTNQNIGEILDAEDAATRH